LDPTTYPSFDPTIGTTTASITGDIVEGHYILVIDADFAETQARLEAIGESLEQFGIDVIANAMHQDSTPSLQSVEIGIVEIRSGSIIIEYALSAPQQLLDLAAERTEQSVGQQLILKIGDSWGQWGTLASFDAVEETTTPSPVTMAPTPMPVEVVVIPVGESSEEVVVQENAGSEDGGGLGGGLTTPILLVVLIGCCLLCVVVAVLVNHGCRKQMDHDGEYHHKYASVAGFQNLYRNRKSKLSKDAMELQHNINMVNQHGQHESDGPYPHSKAHHEEPPLPSMHHHQTSTLESASGSHEDGYSNPPSGQSQDSSSIQQPVPDGGAHPNHRNNNYQYQHHNQYHGRHQHQHMDSPQHGDYLMSTDTESQDDTGTPMNSHISPSMNGHNVDSSESHPAGTVMQVSNNLQRKYFDHKLPAPRSRKHIVENTTGTMEIKVGMHRSAANIDANRMGGLTQTTLATTTETSTTESSYGLTSVKDSKDKNTTVIIHGGYQESKALRTEEVDTESDTDSSTETSGTELDVNTVNSMSSRPGGRARGGDGGFVLLQGHETEHSDDEKMAMPPNHDGHEAADGKIPYQNITNYQFNRLQSAIKTARTRSDFGKLKDIIANGQVPQQNWHGKGSAYDGKKKGKKKGSAKGKEKALAVPHPNFNALASITENQEMKSASSGTENTENLKLPDLGRFAGKQPRMDEDELAQKLAILSSGRRV